MIPNVIRIGHGVFYVTNLEASRRFYVDLLGLNVLHQTPTALYLRGVEDREWTLKLELAPQAGVKHLAFRVATPADLEALITLAQAQNLPWRCCVSRTRLVTPWLSTPSR